MQHSMFIGLDVHKATISVAVAPGERGGEVRHWGTVPHHPDHIRKLAEKLGAGGHHLHVYYEAGPCGYELFRQLVELGHDCIVVAPSLILLKAGDRVKTDRRDAVMLAKLHRAGELTAMWVPDAAHEAMRDLVWERATAMRVLERARQHDPDLLFSRILLARLTADAFEQLVSRVLRCSGFLVHLRSIMAAMNQKSSVTKT